MKKVPISGRRKRIDVLRNEQNIVIAFYFLKEQLGRNPSRLEVAAKTGISRKKVGEYYRRLKLGQS